MVERNFRRECDKAFHKYAQEQLERHETMELEFRSQSAARRKSKLVPPPPEIPPQPDL